jgi:hypothetical protein
MLNMDLIVEDADRLVAGSQPEAAGGSLPGS